MWVHGSGIAPYRRKPPDLLRPVAYMFTQEYTAFMETRVLFDELLSSIIISFESVQSKGIRYPSFSFTIFLSLLSFEVIFCALPQRTAKILIEKRLF